jgi:hypothetical protein
MDEPETEDFLEKGRVPDLINCFPEMKALVSILRCQICYDFMVSNCYRTPVSHSQAPQRSA